MVYSRKIEDEIYTFGISGRLYKSNVLLYDHQTESLWSQIMEKAVAGPMAGNSLVKLSSSRMKWKSWQTKHPDTQVLSDDTGYTRNYSQDPYEGYYRIGRLMFPVGNVRKDLSPKERILGIDIQSNAKAYSLANITRQPGILQDTIGETLIRIDISKDHEVTEVTDSNGNSIPYIFAYWFAWQAFHPDTDVHGQK